MAKIYLDNGNVSDQFEIGKKPLIYKDAIVMRREEYDALSEAEIEEIKKQRYEKWLSIINSPATDEGIIEAENLINQE